MNPTTVDLNFLLDKDQVEKFLNQKAQTLFDTLDLVEVLEIKRTATYNKSSYNVWYKVKIDAAIKEIRASASEQLSKKANFLLLDFIYKHGFDTGNCLIAKPLGYFEDVNVMFYENILGKPLMTELTEDKAVLLAKIKLCAQILKKIHALPKPEVALWNVDDFFEFKKLERGALQIYYPGVAKAIDSLILQIKTKIDKKKTPVFCHGDYNPNNLIINQDKIYVLDFDLSSLIDLEYDLANFVNQLEIMTKRFGNFENFNLFKNEFLAAYGPYDTEKYSLYDALVKLRILATFCVSQGRENNLEFMAFIFEQLKANLKQIGVEFKFKDN